MSRSGYIALFGVLALLVPLGTGSAASAAHETPSANMGKIWPALLPNQLLGIPKPGSSRTVRFRLDLLYAGGANFDYPALGSEDIIPTIRSTIFMPKGAKIVRTKLTVFFPYNAVGNTAAYKLVNGRPVWMYHHLGSGQVQLWTFWVKLPNRARPYEVGVVVQPLVKHAPAVKNSYIIPPVKAGA